MQSIHSTHRDNYYWRHDTQLIPEIQREFFTAAYWQSRHAVLGKESGRGTTWFVQHGDDEWVLRHYLRGGLMSRLSRDRYLFKRWQNCRSIAEFDILHMLHQQGFPVPRPVAAQVIRHGLHYRADILVGRIAQAQDLLRVLQRAQSEYFYQNLAAMIARFMRAGIHHADLNIQNILVDNEGQFWLIDFDRAKQRTPVETWQNKVLARLLRSFEKEKQRHGIVWSASDWEVFIGHYQSLMRA